MSLVIATSVGQVLDELANGARPIAGGTDLVVADRQGRTQLPHALVAIDRLTELQGIEQSDDGGLRVGAGVTNARLMTDEAIVSRYTAIADAAALVGSPSTRNVGTLGGNVINASPAADTGAPLVVLGATVHLASAGGRDPVRRPLRRTSCVSQSTSRAGRTAAGVRTSASSTGGRWTSPSSVRQRPCRSPMTARSMPPALR